MYTRASVVASWPSYDIFRMLKRQMFAWKFATHIFRDYTIRRRLRKPLRLRIIPICSSLLKAGESRFPERRMSFSLSSPFIYRERALRLRARSRKPFRASKSPACPNLEDVIGVEVFRMFDFRYARKVSLVLLRSPIWKLYVDATETLRFKEIRPPVEFPF